MFFCSSYSSISFRSLLQTLACLFLFFLLFLFFFWIWIRITIWRIRRIFVWIIRWIALLLFLLLVMMLFCISFTFLSLFLLDVLWLSRNTMRFSVWIIWSIEFTRLIAKFINIFTTKSTIFSTCWSSWVTWIVTTSSSS